MQEYLLEKINTVVIEFRWGRAEQCVKTERVKKGQEFIFPPAPPAANKEGYQFVGWKYNEKIYVTGEEYKAEENVTFRDEWKKCFHVLPLIRVMLQIERHLIDLMKLRINMESELSILEGGLIQPEIALF